MTDIHNRGRKGTALALHMMASFLFAAMVGTLVRTTAASPEGPRAQRKTEGCLMQPIVLLEEAERVPAEDSGWVSAFDPEPSGWIIVAADPHNAWDGVLQGPPAVVQTRSTYMALGNRGP